MTRSSICQLDMGVDLDSDSEVMGSRCCCSKGSSVGLGQPLLRLKTLSRDKSSARRGIVLNCVANENPFLTNHHICQLGNCKISSPNGRSPVVSEAR
jgi:hypothetical protein